MSTGGRPCVRTCVRTCVHMHIQRNGASEILATTNPSYANTIGTKLGAHFSTEVISAPNSKFFSIFAAAAVAAGAPNRRKPTRRPPNRRGPRGNGGGRKSC